MDKDYITTLIKKYPDKKPVVMLRNTAGFVGRNTEILIFDEPQGNMYVCEYRFYDPDFGKDTEGL